MKDTRFLLVIPLFVLCTAALLLPVCRRMLISPIQAAEPRLTVNVLTPKVTLGGTVYLLIDAPGASAVRLRYGKASYPVRRRGDGRWEGLLGIWREEKPGARTVTIEADADGRTITGLAAFQVTTRAFPIQKLRMTKAQDAIYESPSVQEEYRIIGAALHRETATRAWHGAFRLPVQGRLSTRYGVQRFRNGKKVGVHKGIDLAAARGTSIVAANAGTVVLCRTFGMHGKAIAVDHGGGVVGLYLHLNDFRVKEGDQVTAGQLIGHVGSTGVATGPHCHYALYVHGTAVDPLLWKSVPPAW
ncbi:MAG: M23 family metallopeptidase [Armatimonadota bacterium]